MLGVGGLGGWVALNLACCGVGEMLLLDFDKVELSNLNRQVLYSEADIGRFKAEAAAERLAGLQLGDQARAAGAAARQRSGDRRDDRRL